MENYVRVDGEVNLNGIYYTYVERKISQDTLYYKCIPNVSKAQFLSARTEFSKSVNGLNNGTKSSSQSEKKINFINEYNQPAVQHYFTMYAFPIKPAGLITADGLVNSFIEEIYRPPQA